jgi:hypothetical protein
MASCSVLLTALSAFARCADALYANRLSGHDVESFVDVWYSVG